MILRKFLLFAFLFSSPISFSQNSKIDSLEKLLLVQKEDTNKVNTLNELARLERNKGDYDKSRKYADEVLSLTDKKISSSNAREKNKYSKGKAQAYNTIGHIYFLQGDYPNALKNYFLALEIRQEISDKKGIGVSFSSIAGAYEIQGDYPKTLEYDLKALKISEEFGDKSAIAACLGNIGILYMYQEDYPKALEYDLKSLNINTGLGDKRETAIDLGNIGIVYNKFASHTSDKTKKDSLYNTALEYDFKSLKIREEIGAKNLIASVLGNIGNVYNSQNKFNEALEYYFKSLKLREELKSKNLIAVCWGNIGALYFKQKKYSDADNYMHKALALSKEIGYKEGIRDRYNDLTLLDSAKGNYTSSYEDYKMFVAYRDSLNNEENTKKTVQLQMQYEFDKKEAQAKAEAEVKEAQVKANAKRQQIILLAVSGFLLLVILFAGFIFRSLLQIRKKNIEIAEQKKHIEEKQKEILDSIHYAARIQRCILPTEKYISQSLKRLMKK